MTTWCLLPTLVLYALASFLYLVLTFNLNLPLGKRKRFWMEDVALFATTAGVFFHLIYLLYEHSWSHFLSVQSCALVLLYLWMVWRSGWQSLGSFFLPLALIFLLLSLQQTEKTNAWMVVWSGHSWFLMFHIVCAGVAMLFISGSFLLGIAFFLQERGLKLKKWNLLSLGLPPLLLNEIIARFWLRFGFVFLTIVLMTGVILLRNFSFSFKPVFHVFLALISWTFYAFALNRRWTWFGGRKILLLSFFGFVSLAITFLWNSL